MPRQKMNIQLILRFPDQIAKKGALMILHVLQVIWMLNREKKLFMKRSMTIFPLLFLLLFLSQINRTTSAKAWQ